MIGMWFIILDFGTKAMAVENWHKMEEVRTGRNMTVVKGGIEDVFCGSVNEY